MSAEALRAVMKHSTARGPQLLVQLAIAHLSASRHGHYPKTEATQEEIAKVARLSLSRTKAVIGELVKAGRLFITEKARGIVSHSYELPIRGEVLKADCPGVLIPVPLIREEPYTQTSRADQQAVNDPPTGKIIRYPKQPRKARSA